MVPTCAINFFFHVLEDMPPDTEAPAALEIISEIMFSIKISNRQTVHDIVNEAIKDVNAKFNEICDG